MKFPSAFSISLFINWYSGESEMINISAPKDDEPYSVCQTSKFDIFNEDKSEKLSYTNNYDIIKTYMRQNTIQSQSRWSRFPLVSHKRWVPWLNAYQSKVSNFDSSIVYSEQEDEEDDEKRLAQLDNVLSKWNKSNEEKDQSVSHKMDTESVKFG